MIQHQTILKVADNSGAKYVKCLKVLGGFKKRFAKIGDRLIISVLSLRGNTNRSFKVKKGGVYKALVIRTKKTITMKHNTTYSFNDNTVALMNKQNNPVATRIIGPVSLILKRKYFKFVSISAGVF
jgi:large subunit ribosomal protein L14